MLEPNELPNTLAVSPVNVAGVGVVPALRWVELDEFPTVDTFPKPPTWA